MPLEIWAGEQADRIDIAGIAEAHAKRGLTLQSASGLSSTIVDPRGELSPSDIVSEVLRLAAIGADAIRVLDDPSGSLSHFSWVMGDLRQRDEARLAGRRIVG